MAETANLLLPLIEAAQAQKHITHNEALRILDAVVQMTVVSSNLNAPPASPPEGERWIVGAAPTGAWAGRARDIAVRSQGAWLFIDPKPGWQAFDRALGSLIVFNAGDWSTGGVPTSVALWGVNATPDTTNRLSVSSPASLFNHEGNGHQIKVNKAAAADTASLLFQTAFSGRAEMGLAGNNDFSIKVSNNGSTFFDGVVFDRTTGKASFPSGLESSVAALFSAGATIDGTLNGTAVQSASDDATVGRLLRVGAFGLGTAAQLENVNWDTITATGLYRTGLATTVGIPTAVVGWVMLHLEGAPNTATQIAMRTTVDDLRIRRKTAGTWGAWVPVYTAGNLLQAVSQASGVPTGGVIERGSNANGEFVRFADGTMHCMRGNLSVTNASTASGTLFRSSANVTWTFPVAFAAAPVVRSDCDNADCWATVGGAPTTSSVALRAFSAISQASALNIRAIASGRWF